MELVERVDVFLAPQINLLEEKNDNYEHLLGQEGVYYIYCLARKIANRNITEEEFGMILIHLLGRDKALVLIQSFLHTKENSQVHTNLVDEMNKFAVLDAENGAVNSSHFLVQRLDIAQKAIQEMFDE